MAENNNAGAEIPPNMTIYINNLNEKIKLDGTQFPFLIIFWTYFLEFGEVNYGRNVFLVFCFLGYYYRVEEVAECGVLSVWEDIGGFSVQDAEAQGPSLGYLRRRLFCHQCSSPNAGLPLLRQAYGTNLFLYHTSLSLSPPPSLWFFLKWFFFFF